MGVCELGFLWVCFFLLSVSAALCGVLTVISGFESGLVLHVCCY